MGSARRSRVAATLRLIACGGALAAMASQVGGYVHLAFTTHVTCAEHGELIEAPGLSAASERPSAPDYRADAGAAAHGHDHCLLAPQRRDRADDAFAGTAITRAQLAFVERAVDAVGPPHPIQLILLAPKNSPPV